MLKHNDKNIKEVLHEVIYSNKKMRSGYAWVRIHNAWKVEMGDIINSYTEKLWFRDGKLTVNLTSAPLRNELSMSKDKVIKLLNDACNEKLIQEIIFK